MLQKIQNEAAHLVTGLTRSVSLERIVQSIRGWTNLLKRGQKYKSKQGCNDQESIQSSTTPNPGYQWESDKLTVRHQKREPTGQPFPSR